ncbi:CD40 ligand [Rhinoderma darwinii]|uniref:CD40 ligand n=1 Tax=Rhinoderma darwinii TaxID=43563 RepID=UPI003F66FACB
MINSYNQSPPADLSRLRSPLYIMKISLWIFILSVFAQIVGTCIFGVYFQNKVDKIQEEMSFREDYIFLRKIQKCLKGDNVDSSLLNCKEVLEKFRSLISEITEIEPSGGKHEKLTGSKEISTPMPYVGGEDITLKKETVAIHLVGERPNSMKDALRWQEKGYFTTKLEISYTNGKLQVETPGVYYVYSQVSFCVNSTQFLTSPFVQYMYMKRPHEKERLLLKGANTFVSQTANCALHSSQFGAVFTFNKDDFIFVNVTDPSCIIYSPEFTYFGMFKLGETS